VLLPEAGAVGDEGGVVAESAPDAVPDIGAATGGE